MYQEMKEFHITFRSQYIPVKSCYNLEDDLKTTFYISGCIWNKKPANVLLNNY